MWVGSIQPGDSERRQGFDHQTKQTTPKTGGRVPWDDLQLAQPGAFSEHKAYSLSKLLMAMFSMELVGGRVGLNIVTVETRSILCCELLIRFHSSWAPQAAKHGSEALPVVCCDPGTVSTKMLLAGWGDYGIAVETANDETFLATDAGISGANGKYFVSRRDTKANPEAYDVEARRKLWAVLEGLGGIQY